MSHQSIKCQQLLTFYFLMTHENLIGCYLLIFLSSDYSCKYDRVLVVVVLYDDVL